MIRSRSSKDASAAVSSLSAFSEASAPVPGASPPRGRAKNAPWKWLKPSTRQRVNSSASSTSVATSVRPRCAGSAISACSASSLRPFTLTLTVVQCSSSGDGAV